MFEIEKCFYDIKDKIPYGGQRVIVYNSKYDDFINAIFINGQFYDGKRRLTNITRWKGMHNNIEF